MNALSPATVVVVSALSLFPLEGLTNHVPNNRTQSTSVFVPLSTGHGGKLQLPICNMANESHDLKVRQEVLFAEFCFREVRL